jgi:N-acetylneuraminic acid mutarotase
MKTKLVLSMILLTIIVRGVQAQDYWTQKADFPGGIRSGAGGFSIGDKAYVGMGYDNVHPVAMRDFWEFNPATNVWTQKADFEGGGRANGIGFSIDGKGYYGTGTYQSYGWTKDFWQYDPIANDWIQKADFGGGLRYNEVGFVIGNKGYVGTGSYRSSPRVPATYYNDFWEYDPAIDTWTRKANVPMPPGEPEWKGRTNATGISIGNKGYVGLGVHYYDTRLKDWYEYDPLNDAWTRKTDFPGVQRYGPGSFSIGDRGYVGGGGYYSLLNDFYEFDPATNTWTQRSPIPASGIYNPVMLTVGLKGYLGLGDSNVSGQKTFYEYSPYTITVVCPEDATVSTTATTCDAEVTGIDPVYTVNPALINPVIHYTLTYQGEVYASGTGSISGMTFQKGITYADFSIAEDPSLTCQVIITVEDSVFPVVVCPEDQIYCNDISGSYTVPALTSSDNCGINTINYSITGATTRTGTGNDASGSFEIGTSSIEWTVTDLVGNTSVCTTQVVVNSPISVSIPDMYAVNPGGELNTIYIGYGPTSLTYTTIVSGGTPLPDASYNYLWTTGESTPSITVNPNLPGEYLYSIKVTDSFNCEQSESISVTVIDVRCGNNLDKVELCKLPPGNPEKAKVVCINTIDVVDLLKNGSRLSVCAPDEAYVENQNTTIYPNPNKGSFDILLTDLNSSWCEIKVTDRNGKLVTSKALAITSSTQSVSFDLSGQPKGMYLIKVVSAEGVQMHRMMIE